MVSAQSGSEYLVSSKKGCRTAKSGKPSSDLTCARQFPPVPSSGPSDDCLATTQHCCTLLRLCPACHGPLPWTLRRLATQRRNCRTVEVRAPLWKSVLCKLVQGLHVGWGQECSSSCAPSKQRLWRRFNPGHKMCTRKSLHVESLRRNRVVLQTTDLLEPCLHSLALSLCKPARLKLASCKAEIGVSRFEARAGCIHSSIQCIERGTLGRCSSVANVCDVFSHLQ